MNESNLSFFTMNLWDFATSFVGVKIWRKNFEVFALKSFTTTIQQFMITITIEIINRNILKFQRFHIFLE